MGDAERRAHATATATAAAAAGRAPSRTETHNRAASRRTLWRALGDLEQLRDHAAVGQRKHLSVDLVHLLECLLAHSRKILVPGHPISAHDVMNFFFLYI